MWFVPVKLPDQMSENKNLGKCLDKSRWEKAYSVQLSLGKKGKIRVPSTAEKLQFSRVVSQGRSCQLCPAQSVLPSYLQVDELDLPAVVLQRGADEAKYLLEDAQTGRVSVDSPSNSYQHQAMGGSQDLEAMRLQVRAQEQSLFPGQSQETQVNQLGTQELLHLLAASSETQRQNNL